MLGRILTRLIDAQAPWSEPLGAFVQGILKAILPRVPWLKDLLHGTWLGHPLHAASTDLPIGVLGLAVLFDVLGLGVAATWSVGAAVVLMLLSALSGLADYTDTDTLARRRATVHATVMVLALLLAVASLILRWPAPEIVMVVPGVLSTAGFGFLILGAFVGGDVVYALGNMVDRHAFRPRGGQWTGLDVTDIPEGELVRAKAGAQTLVLVRAGDRVLAMHDTCAHAACSLSKGRLVDGQVECSCHGSRYRLSDGHVTRGPSVYDQPAYEVRRTADGWEARRA